MVLEDERARVTSIAGTRKSLLSAGETFGLNLRAIESSLVAVKQAFPLINEQLNPPREPMNDEVVGNLLSGYAFVNSAVAKGADLFAMGSLKSLLELNTLVLCGKAPGKRNQYAGHIRATAQRFYEQRAGGVRDVVEWLARHKSETVWERAAGTYIRILSEPQLYIEGNHRTGALIMSYILVREGRPPFVLTPQNAKAYFDPSILIKHTKKSSIAMQFRLPKIKKRFAAFLQAQADARHLCQLT